ncbi:mechanosensitive ion channel domain-containing protein [Roseimaritima ulvae]|uniref:mechanosensitive ion channel domain-containing protein n=1 Tax=Roseimaritima ulvae TaxID=980254 RepID=UPI0011CEBFF0|nr:mechanosensitive ion channel domain-containing protein [Roseimaritima ulvae]
MNDKIQIRALGNTVFATIDLTACQQMHRPAIRIGALLAGLLCCLPLNAQDNAESDERSAVQAIERVDEAMIAAGIAEVEAADDLDESQKTALLEAYQSAGERLKTLASSVQQTAHFQKLASTVNETNQALKQQLAAVPKSLSPADLNESEAALEQQLAQAQLDLQKATAAVEAEAAEPGRRQKRLAAIPHELSEAEQAKAEIDEQLAEPAPANESPLVTRARTISGRAASMALEAKIAELKQEQAAYLSTTDLLPLRKQLADRRRQQLRDDVAALQEALVAQRTDAVSDTLSKRSRDLQKTGPALRPLAERNLDLAQRHKQLIGESARVAKDVSETERHLAEVKAALKTSQERLDAVGLSDAMGQMLRSRRREYELLLQNYLPDADLGDRVQQYQVEAFLLEDALGKVSEQLDERKADTTAPSDDLALESLTAEQAETYLLQVQHTLLTDTLQAHNSLLQIMLRGDTERQELRQAIDNYIDFVSTNAFWIRSAPVFSWSETAYIPVAVNWLVRPLHWQILWRHLRTAALSRPVMTLLAVLGLGVLVVKRPRLRRFIREQGNLALTWNSNFRTTMVVLGATVIKGSTWSLAFLLLGWMLLYNEGGTLFVRGVGSGLVIVALYIASRNLLSEICRDGGLADVHFGWHREIRKLLRFHLPWYTSMGAVLIFFLVLFHEHPDPQLRATTSRLTSLFLFLTTAVFHHMVLRPSSPVYTQIGEHAQESKTAVGRKLIWAVVTGLPVLFAGLAMAGYLDTAFRLGQSLQSALLLLMAVVLLMGLMFRWLYLRHRAAARREAREMKRQQRVAAATSEAESLAADVGIELQQETLADLPKLDHQTRQVVYAVGLGIGLLGLVLVWRDIFPAIEIFDELEMWSVTIGDRLEKVTLRDLLYAVLATAATIVAVRNLPGVLELAVLQRTKLDGGARYALTTIVRYALTVAGALVVLNLLAIPWSQLGWLLAAASVGLGFGLQEIVANFVSGIILLLERPVRVGDVVTIDGTSGIVSRIQMRATTVTSWDRKELVVPNKDLITEKLLNWSLSNVVNRLTIEIGVAYGSDPDQVRAILDDVVRSHPDVMVDPGPLINFESFGDSALMFSVRLYLANLDRRIGVTHELNTSIANALYAANIEIPFPQRDIHLRSGDASNLPQ